MYTFLLTGRRAWIILGSMGFLTEKQAEHIWEKQGLKHHVKRLYGYLVQNGLMPMTVRDYAFLENFRKKILINFFVKGVTEDKDGRQQFPNLD